MEYCFAGGTAMKRRIEQLTLGTDPSPWSEAGFTVDGDAMRVGETVISFGRDGGIAGWILSSVRPT